MSQRWQLWRQDDNGQKFMMETYPLWVEAEQARSVFEARGHKQMYVIVDGEKAASSGRAEAEGG